jgi:hypothetical protein
VQHSSQRNEHKTSQPAIFVVSASRNPYSFVLQSFHKRDLYYVDSAHLHFSIQDDHLVIDRMHGVRKDNWSLASIDWETALVYTAVIAGRDWGLQELWLPHHSRVPSPLIAGSRGKAELVTNKHEWRYNPKRYNSGVYGIDFVYDPAVQHARMRL